MIPAPARPPTAPSASAWPWSTVPPSPHLAVGPHRTAPRTRVGAPVPGVPVAPFGPVANSGAISGNGDRVPRHAFVGYDRFILDRRAAAPCLRADTGSSRIGSPGIDRTWVGYPGNSAPCVEPPGTGAARADAPWAGRASGPAHLPCADADLGRSWTHSPGASRPGVGAAGDTAARAGSIRRRRGPVPGERPLRNRWDIDRERVLRGCRPPPERAVQ